MRADSEGFSPAPVSGAVGLNDAVASPWGAVRLTDSVVLERPPEPAGSA